MSPNGSEIFIPQSLLRFEIPELDPMSPPAVPMLAIPSHPNVLTLLCEPFPNTHALQFHLSRVFHIDAGLFGPSASPWINQYFPRTAL